jgi:ferric-dicitrate binding protein FerR (iron transport regulator)
MAREMRITVYGTSFNVSAYHDDNLIQTTLVDGSVGIEIQGNEELTGHKLKPGQQASFDRTTNIVETGEVNTAQYTAWKNGLFVFEGEQLERILQKLSRWYDCEVEYQDQDAKTECFTGEIKRYDSILKILDMISTASDIEFQTEGRKITVYAEK